VENSRRRTVQAWLFVAALVSLAATLGALQFKWLGEVSRAEHDRLRNSLQTSLNHLSRDFDYEITAASAALAPDEPLGNDPEHERDFVARYQNWKTTHAHARLFSGIYVVVPKNGEVTLRKLDVEKAEIIDLPWPEKWASLHERFVRRLAGDRRFGGFVTEDQPSMLEIPIFSPQSPDRRQGRRELEWMLLQVDLDYVSKEMLPDLVRRHLAGGNYQVQVMSRGASESIIFSSDPNVTDIQKKADASVGLFSIYPDVIFRRNAGGFRRGGGAGGGPPREGFGPGSAPGPAPGSPEAGSPGWRTPRRRDDRDRDRDNSPFERGRWELFARHTAGSLEVLVARTRTNNLIVSSAILLLMIGAGTSLLHFTRRSQRLAELQMEFVASVSHELRTPLSVMRTAGHNLQGRVANDPERVRRYGELIKDESEKLTVMVEQVLRFANSKLGRVIGAKELVSIESVIESAIESDRRVLQDGHCEIEKQIPAELPQVLGDATTLKHAIQNILSNAAKYGNGGGWIGIVVTTGGKPDSPAIDIRIADRGAGIPPDELGMIFEAFYRGKRAVSDQIHGTGLGLSLTKRIIEAHGGTITVQSVVGQGTEFLIHLPAVANIQTHELAHSTD